MGKLPELKKFKRIAIIQTAFLGDVALVLYLSEKIKRINSDIELTLVTTPSAATFANYANSIDHVITFDKRILNSGWKGIKVIAKNLRNLKIECILSPHRSFRTTLLTRLAKPDYSVGFDKNALSLLYSKRIKYLLGKHEIERNDSLLNAFDDTNDFIHLSFDVELEIPDDDKSFIENKLLNKGILHNSKNLIAIAPGSVWATKRWLPSSYKELCGMIIENGYMPLIIGSQEDKKIADLIIAGTEAKSLCGETTLIQLIYLLSLCKLIITNDSAPTHLAGLAKCPVITIYGATIPEFGFSPRGKHSRSIGVEGLKCRPCAIHGGNECPIKTFDCMTKLKPDYVYQNVLEIIRSTSS